MLIEQQKKQYTALNRWFQSALGEAVTQECIKQFAPLHEYLKGDSLLQLGSCGDNLWLDAFGFKNKWIASPIAVHEHTDLACSFYQLPLNRNSIDCLIAPLTLEPFFNASVLIDEIDRVLTAMGYVILISFNPWSLWGAAMKCGLLGCYANNKVKMRTPFSLNRMFIQRGYRQCSLSHFCYTPPVNNAAILKKLAFFDGIGKMLWPFPSGLYCYIGQKYEYIEPQPIIEPIIEPLKMYSAQASTVLRSDC